MPLYTWALAWTFQHIFQSSLSPTLSLYKRLILIENKSYVLAFTVILKFKKKHFIHVWYTGKKCKFFYPDGTLTESWRQNFDNVKIVHIFFSAICWRHAYFHCILILCLYHHGTLILVAKLQDIGQRCWFSFQLFLRPIAWCWKKEIRNLWTLFHMANILNWLSFGFHFFFISLHISILFANFLVDFIQIIHHWIATIERISAI